MQMIEEILDHGLHGKVFDRWSQQMIVPELPQKHIGGMGKGKEEWSPNPKQDQELLLCFAWIQIT